MSEDKNKKPKHRYDTRVVQTTGGEPKLRPKKPPSEDWAGRPIEVIHETRKDGSIRSHTKRIKPKSSLTWPIFYVLVALGSLATMAGGYYLGSYLFGSPW